MVNLTERITIDPEIYHSKPMSMRWSKMPELLSAA